MKNKFICILYVFVFVLCFRGRAFAVNMDVTISGIGMYDNTCFATINSDITQKKIVNFAYYKDNRMIDISSQEILLYPGNNVIQSEFSQTEFDDVKVMVWNNMFSISPSAYALTAQKNDLSALTISRLSVLWPGITAEITNHTTHKLESVIYISIHDENDNIISIINREKDVMPGQTVCFSDEIDIPSNCYLKMFVWEKRTMMPLSCVHIYTEEETPNEKIPKYVLNEAKRVSQNVKSAQSDDSLSFVTLTDIHVSADGLEWSQADTRKSLKLAAQGIKLIDSLSTIDAMVLLGDYTTNRNWSAEECKDDFQKIEKELLYLFPDRPVAWLIGNHDLNYRHNRDRVLTEEELYTYIGSNSRYLQRDPQNPYKNYGYTDFPDQKIRMIMLNTIDTLSEFIPKKGESLKADWLSAVQLQWLADTALDFSDKENPSEWGIILCGHHPLNYHSAMQRALVILEAYKDGQSGVIEYEQNGPRKVTYDFTEGEKAEIICSLHGHSHNFGYSKTSSTETLLEEDAPEILVEPWIWRICLPNAMVGRENEHATSEWLYNFGEYDKNGKPIYYRKTADTENGTSFCVVTVNREKRKIYFHTFGAGIDRVISY